MKRIRRARNRRSTIWRKCGTIPVAIRRVFETGEYPYASRACTPSPRGHMLELQRELLKAQRWIEVTGQRIVVLFEGRDAAGKGGTIKRFTEH